MNEGAYDFRCLLLNEYSRCMYKAQLQVKWKVIITVCQVKYKQIFFNDTSWTGLWTFNQPWLAISMVEHSNSTHSLKLRLHFIV